MYHHRRLVQRINRAYKLLRRKILLTIKKQLIWLLRTLFVPKRRRETVSAGFVLPTVVMVSLVVVLLTTAIMFRSFDRSKNASNVRVNEVVLNAATPAIDRARAKLDALFNDPTLPRATPSDTSLYSVLEKDKYRLGDETRLKLGYDINGDGTISNPTSTTSLENDETLKSGWKFAVDTDNNGLKDSYTIYGIYFRNPTRDTNTGQFNRKRIPLETRTPPESTQGCGNSAGFSSLVGNSSWYQLPTGDLGKSFFVYTFNVPITQTAYNGLSNQTGYEVYKGNQGFAALEFEQDRSRVPLVNNAAWFDNDLEITPGVQLLLNGRIHTNGNLLVGGSTATNPTITFRQVSSIYSCFYNQENGQVSVGGNVGTGNVSQTSDQNIVTVDLYQGFQKSITTDSISGTNRSTNSAGGSLIGFNDAAYNQRIAVMQTSALSLCTGCSTATNGQTLKAAVAATTAYPSDVQNNVATLVQDSDPITTANTTLSQQIQIYLQDRTRRVPFAEISDPTGAGATTGFTGFTTSVNSPGITAIDPPANWRNPLNSSNQFTNATSVAVNTSQLNATYPTLQKQQGLQNSLGDRVFVGNNLPAEWLLNNEYVGSDTNQLIYDSSNNAVNWTLPTTNPQQRWRNTQVQGLADLGVSDRNGYWEQEAAQYPINPLDNSGGVRIITGAGIYVDGSNLSDTYNATTGPFFPRSTYSFLPPPNSSDNVVWPDTMPMTSANSAETRKGDLLMRATAVYHYNSSSGTNQTPIACVSSYWDPTTVTTAKNNVNVNGGYGVDTTNGRSNNGVVYDFPGRSTFTTYQTLLQKQATLKFPNGNMVNPALQTALTNIGTATTVPSTGLQYSDYSAIDTALCAISILNGATPSSSLTNKPNHGAIKEASFLDPREARQIGASTSSTSYDLTLEQRSPLEIRVTDIDLGSLASTTITSNSSSDYLLPYSGIIYASRDDASPDQSDTSSQKALLSPTDFKLDPTRRPNGIRLINGQTLARNPSVNNNSYNAQEKGLILVSNLPAYIKGQFNAHSTSTSALTNITSQIEEFTQTESGGTNFYARKTPNTNFACRTGRTGCPTSGGDYWRPATVIVDSMTLLSNSFYEGFRSDGDYDLNNNTGLQVYATQQYGQYNNATSVSTFLDPDPTSFTLSSVTTNTTKSRLKNGFWENSFLPNANWWQQTNDPIYPITSLGSYTLNGVTPIQRRVNSYPLYVMEICRKDLVSQCQPGDWKVGFDVNANGNLGTGNVDDTVSFDVNGDGIVDNNDKEKDIKTYQLGQAIAASPGYTASVLNNWDTQFGTNNNNKSIRQRLGAGTTGFATTSDTTTGFALATTNPTDQRYPRRVAFARDNTNMLVKVSSSPDIYLPIGVGCPLDTTGTAYSSNGCTYTSSSGTAGTNYGTTGNSALWYRTTSFAHSDPGNLSDATYSNQNSLFYLPPIDANEDGSPDLDGQPLLVPVLHIHDAVTAPSSNNSLRTNDVNQLQPQFRDQWTKAASAAGTTFNATFVVANSPSRSIEDSAGLQNFVRFVENWNGVTAKISGSFIQLKRSTFATGPIAPILKAIATGSPTTATGSPTSNSGNLSLFNYPLTTYAGQNDGGITPFYWAPTRAWGFDVGLLSEQPDLFAQRFTVPPVGRPNEFFREVSRDDSWVQALLCSGQASNQTGIVTTGTVTYSAAVPAEYRPSSCLPIPSDSPGS